MRTILEASDWLLGAKGHLPGRGDGPVASRRGVALDRCGLLPSFAMIDLWTSHGISL
jgi:hypothetical protein